MYAVKDYITICMLFYVSGSSTKDQILGHHWVWDSLRSNLKKIAIMMLFSGHTDEYNDLTHRHDNKFVLCN